MEEFNLEKALVGEPVVLRSGEKALVIAKIPHAKNEFYQIIGYRESLDGGICCYWKENGKHECYHWEHPLDIVGMWEEPRPTVQLPPLPAPLKYLNNGDEYWCIEYDFISVDNYTGSKLDERWLLAGRLFQSKSDAQQWLDAMKEARR